MNKTDIFSDLYNPTLDLAMNLAKLLNTTVEKLFILES
ncbi:transcriptional regulator [Clostridium tagluense]